MFNDVHYFALIPLIIGALIGGIFLFFLYKKYKATPKMEFVTMQTVCARCGFRTNGLKCPICNKKERRK